MESRSAQLKKDFKQFVGLEVFLYCFYSLVNLIYDIRELSHQGSHLGKDVLQSVENLRKGYFGFLFVSSLCLLE